MNRIAIIDYGLGNLLSVKRAVEASGAQANFVSNPNELSSYEKIILPGVGAFEDGMNGLKKINIIEALKKSVLNGTPTLGICLGMQMLFDSADEFGHHEGLSLIPGKVTKIPALGKTNQTHKIPHIGWGRLQLNEFSRNPLTSISNSDRYVYFVHSYQAIPKNNEHVLAVTDYDGLSITAAVHKDNLIGVQFHPEKSGPVGLNILKNFIEINK